RRAPGPQQETFGPAGFHRIRLPPGGAGRNVEGRGPRSPGRAACGAATRDGTPRAWRGNALFARSNDPTGRSPPGRADTTIAPRARTEVVMAYEVGVLIGSLAKESINRKLAHAVMRIAPPTLRFQEIPIRDLPLYSYDYDANYPPVARTFKESIEKSD